MEREILAARRRRVKEGPDLEPRLCAATSSCFFDEITTVMHRCKGSEQAFRFLSSFCRERRRGGEKCACVFISASRAINKKKVGLLCGWMNSPLFVKSTHML